MVKVHAKRVAMQQKEKVKRQSKAMASKIFDSASSSQNKSRETSFCGEHSAFVGCVPKFRLTDQYYSPDRRNIK